MPRTTLNIDGPVLRDLRRLQRERGGSLGRVVSDLLAEAVTRTGVAPRDPRDAFRWTCQPMGARFDLADKEALWAALDGEE